MPLEHFRIALSDIRTNFVPAPEHSAKKLGKFSHKVIRGQLDGSQSVWIKKEIGNLGLDDGNRVIKIDGDWCFAQSRNQYTYGLTPRMIDSLPYPIDFYAFNWLDIIMEGEKKRNSKIIDPSLTNAKQFRAEVNQAILKICLLPDSFIDHFVETYMSGAPNYYSKLIQDRRMELLNSALQNQAFKTYLETHEAEEDALSLSRQMGDIFANGNLQVLPISERETMAEEVRLHLKMLQKRNINELESLRNKELKPTTPYEENINILKKIWSNRVNNKDKIMGEYIYAVKTNLKKMSKIELLETKDELNKILQSVESPEALAVKEIVQSYRKNIHWWTVGKEKKAQHIENALANTPLLERQNIITANGPANRVQEALASHRYWGSKGKVYKNKYNEIDYNKAGASFKKLKKRLSKETKEIIDDEKSMNSEIKRP